jgi:hypothetical protein
MLWIEPTSYGTSSWTKAFAREVPIELDVLWGALHALIANHRLVRSPKLGPVTRRDIVETGSEGVTFIPVKLLLTAVAVVRRHIN